MKMIHPTRRGRTRELASMITLEGDGEGISARAMTWERNELPLQVGPWMNLKKSWRNGSRCRPFKPQ
jgi:hypothetical protein